MRTTIYSLNDEHGRPRYVGKTARPLEARRMAHVYQSRTGHRSHKCNWIRSMERRGLSPTIQTLDVFDSQGCLAEVMWIDRLRKLGHKLTNATDGGEGLSGWKMPMAQRRRISRRMKAGGAARVPKGFASARVMRKALATRKRNKLRGIAI